MNKSFHIMIAESGAGRIIEIDRNGKLLKQIQLIINNPHPHMDTRLARKLSNGLNRELHFRGQRFREGCPPRQKNLSLVRVDPSPRASVQDDTSANQL